jgi:hypothetical protein
MFVLLSPFSFLPSSFVLAEKRQSTSDKKPSSPQPTAHSPGDAARKSLGAAFTRALCFFFVDLAQKKESKAESLESKQQQPVSRARLLHLLLSLCCYGYGFSISCQPVRSFSGYADARPETKAQFKAIAATAAGSRAQAKANQAVTNEKYLHVSVPHGLQ